MPIYLIAYFIFRYTIFVISSKLCIHFFFFFFFFLISRMCLSSPKYFESDTSLIPGIALSLNNETVDNGFGVIMENDARNTGREHVREAFRLLRCSSKIQVINFNALILINYHGTEVQWIYYRSICSPEYCFRRRLWPKCIQRCAWEFWCQGTHPDIQNE